MPLSDPGSLATLTGARNHIARWLGATGYSSLDADTQSHVDDSLALAMDRVTREAEFQFALREGALSTVAPYETGTVSVTAGSATVTGSSTLWNTSSNVLKHDKFMLGTTGAYRVSAHPASDTSLTLASAFAGTTASGQSYEIGRDEYTLAGGMLWLTRIWDLETAKELILLTPAEWVRLTQGRYQTGEPTHAILIGADNTDATTGTAQRLQLYPVPDARYSYNYSYKSLFTWTSGTMETMAIMDIVLAAALQLVFWRLQDWTNVKAWEERYQMLLVKAKTQDVARTLRTRTIASDRYRMNQGGRYFPRLPRTLTDPY